MKNYLLITLLLISGYVSSGNVNIFYYVADSDNNLYSVNKNTGVSTLIGATGVSDIEAIAYYPIPGANVLYAVDRDDFGTLDLSTGAFSFIGTVDAAGPANGAIGLQDLDNVDGMMLDGQTFKMWATQRNSGNDLLFQINVNTGQYVKSAFGPGIDYVVITGPGINVDVDDLAISPVTGRMYATNNDGGSGDKLIEINKFNATYSVAATLSEDDVEGLSFHNNGVLYGSEGDDDRFSIINITTGAMTSQFPLSGGDVECFASLVADANTVSGNIFDDNDLDGVLDGGEIGIEGVIINLYIDNNNDGLLDPGDTKVQTTSSDANGDYTFYYISTENLLISTEFASFPIGYALTTDNIETATFTDNVNFGEVDANNNFGLGTGPDCDGDGIPNFYEGGLNSDLDAILDSCDLDSDNDGILDSVEGIEDFDGDGIPNYRDRDSDGDGIPDAIEANQGAEPAGYITSEGNVAGTDSDGNGIVDSRETFPGSGVMVALNPDSDNDGNPDYLDLDSDNDGILDIIEAGGEDSNLDGQVDGLVDTNSNGLDDRIEATPLPIPNTDKDFEDANGLTNLPNYIDIDSDSDGIDDTREGYSTADYDFPTIIRDSDGDGIIDFWDVSNLSSPITPYDRDSDGIPDYLDSDSDNDGVSDLIEGNDSNADGVVDVVLSGVDNDENGLDDALDGLCGETTIYINSSVYAEENVSDGSVSTSNGDLELVNDGAANQKVGVHFANVNIEQGTSISSAYIQFEVDEISTGPISILIEGELSTNASTFSTSSNNVSSRATTVVTASWTPEDWDILHESGIKQRTVNIGPIIEEIVGQGGWSIGNSLVIMFSGPTGNTRVAERDPVLIINTEFDASPTLTYVAADHGEEDNSDGSVNLGSSDIELPNDGSTNQTVGVLFSGVLIDQGQTITSAYIQFEADEVRTGPITLTIEGELSPSASLYSTTVNDVSSRTPTTNSVTWSPSDWNTVGESGAPQQTPDLTDIVQEIVNQSGWSIGNNMSFIITGPSGNRRTAETDPRLVIETTASYTTCKSNVALQDFDRNGEDDFRDSDDDADGIPTIAEIPDANGNGTPDYLEYGGDECGLGYLSTGYSNDYTGVQNSQSGTQNSGNFTGTPDGQVTQFNSNNDEYIIDFEQIYPAGYRYIITWRERSGQSGTAQIVLAESDDNSLFHGKVVNPTTNSTTLFNDTITSDFDFQYIRFRLEDGASSTDFEIDAVGVLVPTCEPDSDDDGIVDSDDIDDDNDGILDTDEGCLTDPYISYASTITSQSGVTSNANITGAPDEQFAQFHEDNDVIVLDFGSVKPAGTSYRIYWRERSGQSGTASILVEESINNATYNTHSSFPATNSTSSILSVMVSENPFRYLRLSKDNPPSSTDFQIDAVGVIECTDTDGDGVPDSHDLDSDNDGIPDIQEAGGVDRDTDSDGRVDLPADNDNDGWADVFDPDDGGTVLPDEDQDGDGLENRIDLDADNDGIADIIEAGGVDANNDGQVDDATDTDGDGFANTFDNDDGGSPLPITDFDGDGIQNYLDLDSDNDGITDNVEGQTTVAFQAPTGSDTDNDGWDNRYDSDNGGTAIILSNHEGIGNPDYLDFDTDGDGQPDWIEGFDDDEDGDALKDLKARATMFVASGGNSSYYNNSLDSDSDQIPNWMEDADLDGQPNFLDPNSPFYFDTDHDGLIDLYDTDSHGSPSILPNKDGDLEPDWRDTDNAISLPITLLSFEVEKKINSVLLIWATLTEINNDYFTIEKSKDGENFEFVGTVKGAGNSLGRLNYKLLDTNPYYGVSYYRLKQTDFNGEYAYSELKSVDFESNATRGDGVKVYPNPNNGYQLFLEVDETLIGSVQWRLFNEDGKLIIENEISISENRSNIRVEVLKGKTITPGFYILKLITPNNTMSKKVIFY